MKTEVINKILENHEKWLSGKGGERINLADTNLVGINLASANLVAADFKRANLVDANLAYSNLADANLESANLGSINLTAANLVGANLAGANLEDAELMYANFAKANLIGAKNVPYIPLACPSDGAFVGWKRARGKIVKLQILEDSRRVSATTRKCRCDKAYVMEIQDRYGNKLDDIEINSDYDENFVYRVGEIAEVKNFCEDRWNECSEGIHFFVNRQDAVNYY